jgi:DNA invertase Pin-like site-specific DNA recombinase
MTNYSRLPSSIVVGYLRVSTTDQDLEKNKTDILQLANNHDLGRVRFVEEKISGKVCWRNRKLAEVLGSLQANDAIIVSELSRLGRSMLECMEILSVATQKRINIYSFRGLGT